MRVNLSHTSADTRHTARFLIIWLFLLPLALWEKMHWGVVPATVVVRMCARMRVCMCICVVRVCVCSSSFAQIFWLFCEFAAPVYEHEL